MKNFDSEKTFNDFVEMVDKKTRNLDEFSIAGNIRNARQEGELVYDYTNKKGNNVTGILGYQKSPTITKYLHGEVEYYKDTELVLKDKAKEYAKRPGEELSKIKMTETKYVPLSVKKQNYPKEIEENLLKDRLEGAYKIEHYYQKVDGKERESHAAYLIDKDRVDYLKAPIYKENGEIEAYAISNLFNKTQGIAHYDKEGFLKEFELNKDNETYKMELSVNEKQTHYDAKIYDKNNILIGNDSYGSERDLLSDLDEKYKDIKYMEINNIEKRIDIISSGPQDLETENTIKSLREEQISLMNDGQINKDDENIPYELYEYALDKEAVSEDKDKEIEKDEIER